MADRQSTKPARGTRDFLPDDLRRREYVIGIVRDVYRRYGFEPLETPAFENIETLMGKYGEEGNQLIFKILKRGEHEKSGEADLALRYDLTVPLARVVAEYQGALPTLFKRYQIQPVWRADRPARGRFREFYQCDIDAIGSTSIVVEVELLSAVSEVMVALGFDDFVVRINHRHALTLILRAAGIADSQFGDALVALDKLDKIGETGIEEEFSRKGLPSNAVTKLLGLLRRAGADAASEATVAVSGGDRNKYVIGQMLGFAEGFGDLDPILQLDAIVDATQGTPAAGRLRIDPSLARGLSYYTGAIMEVAVPDLSGSLGGGGRYDNLVGMFLGRDVPACGFSLGLERIIVVMTERGMFPPSVVGSIVDIVVTFLDDGSMGEALALAGELRTAGWRVDVFPEASRKFDRSLKYASARGARAMAIFGENERARGEASIRNLATREQTAVPRSEAADAIARLLRT